MNYVVAALLLGRIPQQYTDITEIDAVVDGDGGDSSGGDDNNNNSAEESGDTNATSEPAAAIVRAPIEYSMPGTLFGISLFSFKSLVANFNRSHYVCKIYSLC